MGRRRTKRMERKMKKRSSTRGRECKSVVHVKLIPEPENSRLFLHQKCVCSQHINRDQLLSEQFSWGGDSINDQSMQGVTETLLLYLKAIKEWTHPNKESECVLVSP